MKKIDATSKQFHDLVFYIWEVLFYYATYFGYDVPETACKMNPTLFRDGTLSKIRVSVPCIRDFKMPCEISEMRDIMNEYLQIMLKESTLSPFAAGNDSSQIVEPLYITIIVSNGSWFDMDFLYVDNMDAYHMVKENRANKTLRIL